MSDTMTLDEFKNITVHKLFKKFRDSSIEKSGISPTSSFVEKLDGNGIQYAITGIIFREKPSPKLSEVEIQRIKQLKHKHIDEQTAYLPKDSPSLPLYDKLAQLIDALQAKDYSKTAELAGIKLVDKKESVDRKAENTAEKLKEKKWAVKDGIAKRGDAERAR